MDVNLRGKLCHVFRLTRPASHIFPSPQPLKIIILSSIISNHKPEMQGELKLTIIVGMRRWATVDASLLITGIIATYLSLR